MKSISSISQVGIDGALMTLSPLPIVFAFVGTSITMPHTWRLIIALLSAVASFTCALILFRRPFWGKLLGSIAAIGSYITSLPYILTNPFAALIASVILISTGFIIIDFSSSINSDKIERCFQRAWWGALVIPFIVIINMLMSETIFTVYVITLSSIIAQILFAHWAIVKKTKICFVLFIAGIILICLDLFFSLSNNISNIIIFISFVNILLLTRNKAVMKRKGDFWEILLNHPARILFVNFLGLSIVGALLLILPASTNVGIGIVDAAFTSVSAVCVTGLTVLNIPFDFTLCGQFFILLLIQLGGIGIMSITTVALHTIGYRFSLKHELLLTSMTDTDHKDLIRSLITILKFTFAVEIIGAFILSVLFYYTGDTLSKALWNGIFTAISAFCNAGFALQQDSLISYQLNPFVLNVIAALIILGGIAPATSLIFPKYLTGNQVPISAHIVFVTTIAFLFSGTIFIMAFEWNGILANLSFIDKIQNAWFQSVTLRTAGFNSVDITNMTSPTFLVMIFFMFVGGSPGSTAGGIKTTTFGILAMTFWSNIRNRNDVISQNRRIPSGIIYQAITIVASGIIFWFIIILMLEVTQQISARDLIFEVTSAIGTVGLSSGATPFLDEIGKIIIIIAMFGGRIGPMTLFMLLSDERKTSVSRCPDAKISLT